MTVITLTTDFGLQDGFVGTMKGVILGITPGAQLVDITHTIRPQGVLEGAFALQQACPYFPVGTVHLAIIDPGVGTERRPLALRLGGWFCVGPDNGLFTPLFEDAEKHNWPIEIIHLKNPRYWLQSVSCTFHGRDIFAPVAAHLAKGVPLAEFGTPVSDPLRLELPRPEATPHGWHAHIIGIDVFGNLTTDLAAADVIGHEGVIVRIGQCEIRGVAEFYGQRPRGELVALADSAGRLEVAVVNGSAAERTGARVGDTFDVVFL